MYSDYARGWAVRGSNLDGGEIFRTRPPSHTMGTGIFPGVKWPRRGADHLTPSNADVEGRVELYICSPSGPSWSVLGLTLFYTRNNPCFWGIQCCTSTVVRIRATCNIISPAKHVLYFHISTFRSMCAVHNMAVL